MFGWQDVGLVAQAPDAVGRRVLLPQLPHGGAATRPDVSGQYATEDGI